MVDRGSTEHSPRLDDEMASETRSITQGSPVEARAAEWHQMEPAADDEPAPDAHVSTDDVEQRSLLAISLRPSAFPGDRERLTAVAAQEHAEESVLALLGALPEGAVYPTLESVWEALGGEPERREHEPVTPVAPAQEPSTQPAAAGESREPEPEPVEIPRADPLTTGVAIVVGVASTATGIAVAVVTEVVRRVRRLL